MTAPVSSAGLRAERWVRFESVDASAFDLARYWAERMIWPATPTRSDLLHELAVMSRLADWLWRWQPLLVHRAVLAGADADQVAAAVGAEVSAVAARWRRWAEGQRRLYDTSWSATRVGLSPVDQARVAAVLVEPGQTTGARP
ncbi:MAG: hypothetical protein ACRD0A_20475 [Acidimicrobiales bacterium]